MQRVLIIGASGGIGSAVADEFAQNGAEVQTLSRSQGNFDYSDLERAGALLDGMKGPFDVVFVATGALVVNGHQPEKSLRGVTPQGQLDQFIINAVGPTLVLQRLKTLLPKDRPSVCGVLSAKVGSIGDNGLGGWMSYRMAKSALNQAVRTASIELARSHPQSCVTALHPGTVVTEFTKSYLGRHPAISAAESAKAIVATLNARTPGDTGRFVDRFGNDIPW